MSRVFLTPLDLAQNELQNPVIQNLPAAPTSPAPKKGQLYMNSASNTLFWFDGGGWVSAVGGAGAFPGYGASVASTTFGQAKADGSSATVARSDHTHGTPNHDGSAHATIPVSQMAPATASLSWGGNKITNLANGTAATDAVNKSQLDEAIQGLDAKQSVVAASVGNVALSGTSIVNMDGVGYSAGDRVLVKNQTDDRQNGIYIAAAGAWSRAPDMDTWTEVPNAFVFVENGTTQADTGWVATPPVFLGTIGNTSMPWTQFAAAGQVVAGAGLTKTGNTLDVIAGLGIVANADDIAVNFMSSGGDNGTGLLVARGDHTHPTFTASVKGLVPPPTTATGKFLKDDATWAAPPAAVSKYAVGCQGATSTVVTHNLGTTSVIVQVFRQTTPFDQVECDVEHTSTNTVTVRFAVAPAANAYTIVVLG